MLLCNVIHYAVPATMCAYNNITENHIISFSFTVAALIAIQSDKQEVFPDQSLVCCEVV